MPKTNMLKVFGSTQVSILFHSTFVPPYRKHAKLISPLPNGTLMYSFWIWFNRIPYCIILKKNVWWSSGMSWKSVTTCFRKKKSLKYNVNVNVKTSHLSQTCTLLMLQRSDELVVNPNIVRICKCLGSKFYWCMFDV